MGDSACVPSSASAVPATAVTPRHAVLVRVTHWITTACFLALLVSGTEIVIFHPHFYWGENRQYVDSTVVQAADRRIEDSRADLRCWPGAATRREGKWHSPFVRPSALKQCSPIFQRYGFNGAGESFWGEVDLEWRKRLTPQPAHAKTDALNDEDWRSTLSIGESYMMTTALQISRFFQAVGNGGLLCAAVARRITKGPNRSENTGCKAPTRIVEEAAARKIMAAAIDTVQRGSACRISGALHDVGMGDWREDRHGRPSRSADGRTGRMVRRSGFRRAGEGAL